MAKANDVPQFGLLKVSKFSAVASDRRAPRDVSDGGARSGCHHVRELQVTRDDAWLCNLIRSETAISEISL